MKYVSLSISIGLTLLVFSMSLTPGSDSASLSLGITEWAHGVIAGLFPKLDVGIDDLHVIIRKAAHITEYIILAISWTTTLSMWQKTLWQMLAIGAIISGTDEILQIFASERGPSAFDAIVFDFIPFSLTAIIMLWLIHRIGEKRMPKEALEKLEKQELTPEDAYQTLFEQDEKIKKPQMFRKAHLVKMKITIPEQKGVNTLLRVLFFIPFPLFLVRIAMGFVKIDKYVDKVDLPLTKSEIYRLISYRGIKVHVNANSGERILIKTI